MPLLFVAYAGAWFAGVVLGAGVTRVHYVRKLKAFDMPCMECACRHVFSVHLDEGDGRCMQQFCPCQAFLPVRKTL